MKKGCLRAAFFLPKLLLMRKLLFLFLLLSTFGYTQVQNVNFTIEPSSFNENEQITITVSNVDPTLWNSGQPDNIYLWAWYFDANNVSADAPNNGEWTNSNEAQQMTNNGNGTYSYTLTPSTFYNTTGITRIGMLVKAKNGDGDKKSQDFLADVGRFQLTLTSPSNSPLIVNAGENFQIAATATLEADFILKANDVQIHSSTAPTTTYNYTYAVNEETSFVIEATHSGETLSERFEVLTVPTVTEEALPTGLLDGLNPHPSDPTKATLVFYAPGKDFIHVIGDFNNWERQAGYLMKKDPATDRFWLEISELTPQFNHQYQYLVNGTLNVADPYSTLILDEFNDTFIDTTTYPDLPAYPTGLTNGAVTVLRLGDPEYQWQSNQYQRPAREDLIIYELLVRDFDERHTFDAVRDRLDYLEELGINAIELMPVNEFDGNESWGYNPSFHMALDKYYGTKNAFKQLIDECHSRGIAVIIDVVYNHASGQHPYFRMWNDSNGGFEGQASADNPFFNIQPRHSYNVFNDFNHQSEATRAYVERTAKYWIEEFRIDGFRWDLTKGFTQNCGPGANQESCTNDYQADRVNVLKLYADYQWEVDPDFYVIFEHLGFGGSAQEELEWVNYRLNENKGIMFWDKLTDPYNEATMGYHEDNKSNFSSVSYQVKNWPAPSNISYMESHDEERLMYKNLEFGNENSTYSTKELSTALERMKLAGAFFFTVPGPKMLWQFGELGYEISINFNGRTGNKPIRWDYLEQEDRKALYDTWSDLILLRKNEPVFTTENFSLDTGNTNGLKKIHLSTQGADDEITYITIIGNFGITEQTIEPQFQETGVWYSLLESNLKHIVTNTTAPIMLQPGEFRIYGNNPTALFPDINPPDEDHDGVPDANDTCPGTPLGATVDVNGCEVFSLPASNFTVKVYSETCRSEDNGRIQLTAAQNLNYTATLSINGSTPQVKSFTSEVEFDRLSADTYQLCITVEGQAYERCFSTTVTEPEDLTVFSAVHSATRELTLTLSGGNTYTIFVNDTQYLTTDNEITIQLKDAVNRVSVRTDKECQGIYEETIQMYDDLRLSPNPVTGQQVYIDTPTPFYEDTTISIFSISGQQISQQKYTANDGRGRISVNVNTLPPGMYILTIQTGNTFVNRKIIKQ